MSPALTAFLAILGGFLASGGGFWLYLKNKFEKRDEIERLIMGLAHDKIVCLGIEYIERGWINSEEYSDFFKYFWDPYQKLGGDGSAERIINLVKMLPLRPELRQFPEIRKIADTLHQGSEEVIDQLKKGDAGLERNE